MRRFAASAEESGGGPVHAGQEFPAALKDQSGQAGRVSAPPAVLRQHHFHRCAETATENRQVSGLRCPSQAGQLRAAHKEKGTACRALDLFCRLSPCRATAIKRRAD
jgi:hypothetical protein